MEGCRLYWRRRGSGYGILGEGTHTAGYWGATCLWMSGHMLLDVRRRGAGEGVAQPAAGAVEVGC